MVVDDLLYRFLLGSGFPKEIFKRSYQEIMFGVFENHVNGFIFKNYFFESNYIFMRNFSVELKRR